MSTLEKPCHERSLDLVVASQRGDREAFGELYALHSDDVHRFVARRVRDHHTAVDIVSATFVKALQALLGASSAEPPDRNVSGWLFTIASNLILDHVTSSRHLLDFPVGEVPDRESGVGCPVARVVERETSRELRCRVAELRDGRRQVVELRFWRELTVAETAVVMGRSESAVKALTFKATRELAEAMNVDGAVRVCANPGCAVTVADTRCRYCGRQCFHAVAASLTVVVGDRCNVPSCRRLLTKSGRAQRALTCSKRCNHHLRELREASGHGGVEAPATQG